MMEGGNGETMMTTLTKLNDDCFMMIFDLLPLMDFVNFGITCSRVRDAARAYSSKKLKALDITELKKASNNMLSKREFSKVLSLIGHQVLEVTMRVNDPFMFKEVEDKCKNIKSLSVIWYDNTPINQLFGDLRPFIARNGGDATNKKQYQGWVAESQKTEETDFYHPNHRGGFMERLRYFPNLESLQLPYVIGDYFHQRPNFRRLLQLTGLKKLTLRSGYNLNELFNNLTGRMNLVALDITCELDDKSIGILQSFRNLEVLTIYPTKDWKEEWYSDAAAFPPGLKRLKMNNIQLSLSKFLELVQHLNSLQEFDFGKLGEISWDDECKFFYSTYIYNFYLFRVLAINFKDSPAMFIQAIENVLACNQRKLKIINWVHKGTASVSKTFDSEISLI